VIAVDTNVIAYLYLEGERSSASERLLAKDPEWIAPILWRSEFRNILALYLRRGVLDFEAALQIMREAENLMAAAEFEPASALVLALVRDSHCSAYDCEFVALARYLDIPLVTADRQLVQNFPETACDLVDFVNAQAS